MTKSLDTLGYHFLRVASSGLKYVPHSIALGMGRFLGEVVYLFSGRRKRSGYADLKAVFGNRFSVRERYQILRRQYGHLGEIFVDLLSFPEMTQERIARTIQIHHESRYLDALDKKKGVIVITAHFGNWELLQLVSNVYYGHPVNLMAAAQKHGRMNDYLNSLRSYHGSKVITREGKGMGLFLKALRLLRGKKVIGIVGDQDDGKKSGLIVPLFGRKTTIPTGAFELAHRTGAPVFPCFLARTGGESHELFMEEPIRCLPAEEEETAIKKGVTEYVKLLEAVIQKYPAQWLWGVKRWKYSWTKRILILTSGKTKPLEQAKQVVEEFRKLKTQYDRPGMEYPTEVIQVRFKSVWHRLLFNALAVFFIPWAQGRLSRLKPFFTPETLEKLEAASTDFILSDNPSLTALNLCLGRESQAKSLSLETPPFLYRGFRFELIVSKIGKRLQTRLREIL